MSNPSVAENVAPRVVRVRISPHVHNDEEKTSTGSSQPFAG